MKYPKERDGFSASGDANLRALSGQPDAIGRTAGQEIRDDGSLGSVVVKHGPTSTEVLREGGEEQRNPFISTWVAGGMKLLERSYPAQSVRLSANPPDGETLRPFGNTAYVGDGYAVSAFGIGTLEAPAAGGIRIVFVKLPKPGTANPTDAGQTDSTKRKKSWYTTEKITGGRIKSVRILPMGWKDNEDRYAFAVVVAFDGSIIFDYTKIWVSNTGNFALIDRTPPAAITDVPKFDYVDSRLVDRVQDQFYCTGPGRLEKLFRPLDPWAGPLGPFRYFNGVTRYFGPGGWPVPVGSNTNPLTAFYNFTFQATSFPTPLFEGNFSCAGVSVPLILWSRDIRQVSPPPKPFFARTNDFGEGWQRQDAEGLSSVFFTSDAVVFGLWNYFSDGIPLIVQDRPENLLRSLYTRQMIDQIFPWSTGGVAIGAESGFIGNKVGQPSLPTQLRESRNRQQSSSVRSTMVNAGQSTFLCAPAVSNTFRTRFTLQNLLTTVGGRWLDQPANFGGGHIQGLRHDPRISDPYWTRAAFTTDQIFGADPNVYTFNPSRPLWRYAMFRRDGEGSFQRIEWPGDDMAPYNEVAEAYLDSPAFRNERWVQLDNIIEPESGLIFGATWRSAGEGRAAFFFANVIGQDSRGPFIHPNSTIRVITTSDNGNTWVVRDLDDVDNFRSTCILHKGSKSLLYAYKDPETGLRELRNIPNDDTDPTRYISPYDAPGNVGLVNFKHVHPGFPGVYDEPT